jgi:large subunit ribosomal protein L3
MAGHFGMERNTLKKVQVVQIDTANNYLMLKGGVPGGPGTLVEIYKA